MKPMLISALLLFLTLSLAQPLEVQLEPLELRAQLSAPANVYRQGKVMVIDFALGKRQAQNCTLEKLESPRGDILAYGTAERLGNGLTLRYDLSFKESGSGGKEGVLAGLLYSNQQLYKVTGHMQSELSTPNPEFCIEVFATLQRLSLE